MQRSLNPVSSSNSKHIGDRHNFLRELIRHGDISVNRFPFEYQNADILSKALTFETSAIHQCFFINQSIQ